ncbi:hypothetical protein DDN60_12650 [Vibrio cholerae]|nr:hypothetical protein [Vibrio cholerae]
MHKVRMDFAAFFCTLFLGGCINNSQNSQPDIDASKSMHQPKIEKLVAIDANELIKPSKDAQSKKVAISKSLIDTIIATSPTKPNLSNEKAFTEKSLIENDVVIQGNDKEANVGNDLKKSYQLPIVNEPLLVNSNWPKENTSIKITPFEFKKGERYRDILNTWLKNAGYKRVEFVLTNNDSELLDKKSNETSTYIETLPSAIDKLMKKVVYSNNSNHASNGFYISFIEQKATIYSASQQMHIHRNSSINEVGANLVDLHLYKGETYESALMRWLYDSGYERLGKLLSRETQLVLSQTIQESEVMRETLEKATTLLLYRARQQALNDPRNEVDNFISDVAKANVEHHLYLDRDAKEAILTSSNQPVVMFNVKPGSLKANFLDMANEFGWKADASHYIADEYHISFGYPIVAERGNIKPALNKLLADFSKLRGAIVPSTREVYVVMER